MNKKVLITGVTGQTGSYMLDYLLENTNHDIYGMVRRLSVPNYKNIQHNLNNKRFQLVTGDLSDYNSIEKLVREIQPNYVINFAANSFVGTSWELPIQHFELNAMGVLKFLEAIKKFKPDCRFYSSGSSEEDGKVSYSPQDLKHPPHPRSPYGCAKVAARFIVQNYRESFNLYAIHCRCHNHEGPRRGTEFVTKKITLGVAKIYHALKSNQNFEPISLGNVESKRDWSHAKDFVEGIWAALNQDIYRKNWDNNVHEYIFSSEETHSVKEFIELAFKKANIYGFWQPEIIIFDNFGNKKEVEFFILDSNKKEKLIIINPKFYRLAEVDLLHGDSTLARTELGWKPKYSFDKLVEEMIDYDIENFTKIS